MAGIKPFTRVNGGKCDIVRARTYGGPRARTIDTGDVDGLAGGALREVPDRGAAVPVPGNLMGLAQR